MKSLAICVLILAVVGFVACGRHRRQAPPPPEGAIPDGVVPEGAIPDGGDAAPPPPESSLNLAMTIIIAKTVANADLTGTVDRKAVAKSEKLCVIAELVTAAGCSESNQQGIADLQDRIVAEDAAAAEAAAAEAAAADSAAADSA